MFLVLSLSSISEITVLFRQTLPELFNSRQSTRGLLFYDFSEENPDFAANIRIVLIEVCKNRIEDINRT